MHFATFVLLFSRSPATVILPPRTYNIHRLHIVFYKRSWIIELVPWQDKWVRWHQEGSPVYCISNSGVFKNLTAKALLSFPNQTRMSFAFLFLSLHWKPLKMSVCGWSWFLAHHSPVVAITMFERQGKWENKLALGSRLCQYIVAVHLHRAAQTSTFKLGY